MSVEFRIEVEGNLITITEHCLGKNQVFRAIFSDVTLPLLLTKTKCYESGKFWTSIPEGRQMEAEKIGNLITEYFKQK